MAKFEIHLQTPPQPPYAGIREAWRAAEDVGYDGVVVLATANDPAAIAATMKALR